MDRRGPTVPGVHRSAGMDLRANISESITLKSLERTLVKTGLFIELPIGYEAQIRPRSGLAFKNGVTVLNSPGTIDADYRGEIKVILVNLSNNEFIINDGERIAQMVIAKEVTNSKRPPVLKYDPNSPDANAEGNVAYPDINTMSEMANMIEASRAYEANINAMTTAKSMAMKDLEIGRN